MGGHHHVCSAVAGEVALVLRSFDWVRQRRALGLRVALFGAAQEMIGLPPRLVLHEKHFFLSLGCICSAHLRHSKFSTAIVVVFFFFILLVQRNSVIGGCQSDINYLFYLVIVFDSIWIFFFSSDE